MQQSILEVTVVLSNLLILVGNWVVCTHCVNIGIIGSWVVCTHCVDILVGSWVVCTHCVDIGRELGCMHTLC